MWSETWERGDQVVSPAGRVWPRAGGRGCLRTWKERPSLEACMHSFIHHSFIVSFIVIHHSFTFSHSDSLIFYLFIHLPSLIIHSLPFIRHSVNPHSAACSGDESDPSLPTLKGPRFWVGGRQTRKPTEGQLEYLFYPQGGFHSPGLPGWAHLWAACGCNWAVCG